MKIKNKKMKNTDQTKREIIEIIRQLNERKAAQMIAEKINGKEYDIEIVNMILRSIYDDAGINASKIHLTENTVEGYEGNGGYTLDDPDYKNRFFKFDII